MFQKFMLTLLAASPAACEKPEPLVMSVSGGGYTSMTGGMAVARALRNLNGRDALAELTHLGGNSGGSFFNNQFLHSEAFFTNVTDASLPMDVLVSDWLAQHLTALSDLMDKHGPLQQEFGSISLLQKESGCAAVNLPLDTMFSGFSEAAKYPLRFLPYVGAAVLKHSLGDKSASITTYADVQHTLPGVSLVSQITLPPDAFTSHNADAGHTNVSNLHAAMKNGSAFNFVEAGVALPIAFVSEGPEKHGWHYNSDIESLLISPTCPYKGLFNKKKCEESPYQPPEMTPLALPEHPLIAEIMAASGGATGFAGSPSIYRRMAALVEDYVIHAKFDDKLCDVIPEPLRLILKPVCEFLCQGAIVTKPVFDEIIKCWPYGAQVLGPPMVRQGAGIAEAEEDVPFRYMDGGYAENTALPMTLAKAQRDCEQGLLDCSEPIRLILVNDGNVSSDYTGPGCCQAKDPLKSLFADPSRPIGTFVPGMVDTVKVPVQTIFAEAFPAKSEWAQYLEFPSKRKLHPLDPLSEKWVEEPIRSVHWDGVLTTVDNKHFGVKGGQKVHLLVFSLEIPGIIWPGLGDAEATQLVSPGHLRLASGAFANSDQIAGHAPMAKAQAAAVVPVLEAFLTPPAATYV